MMQFHNFTAFIEMGGYGFFVWLSYGVTAVLLTGLLINSIYAHKKIIRQINQRQKREQKLRQAAELHQSTSQDITSHNKDDSQKVNS